MNKIFFKLIFTVFLFTTANVFAQDDPWEMVGETDLYKVYMNKDSVKNSGDAVSEVNVWMKLECKGECNDGYKSVSYSIQNWIIYCDKNEYMIPMSYDYYTDGDQNTFKMTEPSKILENSPGEKAFNYFCKKEDK